MLDTELYDINEILSNCHKPAYLLFLNEMKINEKTLDEYGIYINDCVTKTKKIKGYNNKSIATNFLNMRPKKSIYEVNTVWIERTIDSYTYDLKNNKMIPIMNNYNNKIKLMNLTSFIGEKWKKYKNTGDVIYFKYKIKEKKTKIW